MPHHDEHHAVNMQLGYFARFDALRQGGRLGQVGIIHASSVRPLKLAADRTSRTAKAFSNGTDAALVVAHEHDDRTVLWSQMVIVSRHCNTLQQGVLHLVLENALDSLSKNILFYIRTKPAFLPLTSIATGFGKGKYGCGGVDSITKYSDKERCPVGRDHLHNPEDPDASHGIFQKPEKILFTEENYKWKVGQ